MDTAEARPIIESSYRDTFGMFRDDPNFADFLAEVDKYRRQGNEVELHANNPHGGVLDSAKDELLPTE